MTEPTMYDAINIAIIKIAYLMELFPQGSKTWNLLEEVHSLLSNALGKESTQ